MDRTRSQFVRECSSDVRARRRFKYGPLNETQFFCPFTKSAPCPRMYVTRYASRVPVIGVVFLSGAVIVHYSKLVISPQTRRAARHARAEHPSSFHLSPPPIPQRLFFFSTCILRYMARRPGYILRCRGIAYAVLNTDNTETSDGAYSLRPTYLSRNKWPSCVGPEPRRSKFSIFEKNPAVFRSENVGTKIANQNTECSLPKTERTVNYATILRPEIETERIFNRPLDRYVFRGVERNPNVLKSQKRNASLTLTIVTKYVYN